MSQDFKKNIALRLRTEIAAIPGPVLRIAMLASLSAIALFVALSGFIFEFTLTREAASMQDFLAFHAAGEAAARGNPEILYSPDAFRTMFTENRFLLWLYPPHILPLLAPFGLMPYGAAKAIWVFASLGAMFAAAYSVTRQNLTLAVITVISPAIWVLLITGQFSVFFACLLAFGLLYSKSRPIIAGVCLGILTVKPQYGLLVPLFLILTGAWRTTAVAAVVAIALGAASLALYGSAPWQAFLASLQGSNDTFFAAYGHTGRITLGDAFGNLGWTSQPAGLIKLALLGAGGALLSWAWRRQPDHRMLTASTLMLTAATSPYFWVYDWPVVMIAILIFITNGAQIGRLSQLLLGVAWLAPLTPYLAPHPFIVPFLWAGLAAATAVVLGLSARFKNVSTPA